ncbi:hypothetical protein SAMN02745857_00868 [Andreprevotia lacus DSM 23236]|uniref:Uncharacterized protein n=1 Tax=Andreprevotia lacus DSM 23236 TaxID=1121001 RepID=A0A1W1X8S4_9NEIS|nr:DUF6709 family protein [Andreprevotia lacus]SMC20217.1 hypothetical protein SAMN02745857_00868 [Andreprevotia lacus DSM 23236]
MESWIFKKIRNTSRTRLVACCGIIIVALLACVANRVYLVNFFAGPHLQKPEELAAISDVTAYDKRFARIVGTDVINTGMREVVTSRSKSGVETTEAEYSIYAVKVGDRYLPIISDSGSHLQYNGELVTMPRELSVELPTTAAEGKPAFYPFVLDSSKNYRTPGYWGLGALALALAAAAYGISKARGYLRDPSSHPLIQRMNAWGKLTDISHQIERELRNPRIKLSGAKLTENYVIKQSLFHFDVARHEDLVWAYKSVTRHSYNFIPTGKTYAAIFHWNDTHFTLSGKEKHVDAALDLCAQQAPWAMFGYDADLEKEFGKRKHEFTSMVSQRRQDTLASAAA